jgi:hypothetical protein
VEEVLPPGELLHLLGRSDIVVLSAPLTAETQKIIGSEALSRVKRGALLINVGRGKLIDDEAVIEALKNGQLGGAALDVFAKEPLEPSSPYWDLLNVIVTPHISGAMEDYWTPLVALFCENLRRFEAGQPLLNVIDKPFKAGHERTEDDVSLFLLTEFVNQAQTKGTEALAPEDLEARVEQLEERLAEVEEAHVEGEVDHAAAALEEVVQPVDREGIAGKRPGGGR